MRDLEHCNLKYKLSEKEHDYSATKKVMDSGMKKVVVKGHFNNVEILYNQKG